MLATALDHPRQEVSGGWLWSFPASHDYRKLRQKTLGTREVDGCDRLQYKHTDVLPQQPSVLPGAEGAGNPMQPQLLVDRLKPYCNITVNHMQSLFSTSKDRRLDIQIPWIPSHTGSIVKTMLR